MTKMIISFLIIVEITAFGLGIFLLLRKKEEKITKALAYAAILSMAFLSMMQQLFFMVTVSSYYFLVDIVMVSFSLWQIVLHRKILKEDVQRVVIFLKHNKWIAIMLLPVGAYLFLQVLLLPPGNPDSMIYNLTRVLMFQQEGSLFLQNSTTFHQSVFPVGFDILTFQFLRFYSDYGLAFFSFISYLALIAATFAWVKAVLNQKLALTVSFIIASLTELVFQATITKNDIPCAAVAVVMFLAAYYFYINKQPIDLYMMIVGALWGISIKGYFLGFLLPFGFFYVLLWFPIVLKRGFIKSLVFPRLSFSYAYFLPIGLLLCSVLFYGHQIKEYGSMYGAATDVATHKNLDGISGAFLNAGRYWLQSAEIPVKYGYKLNELHRSLLKEHQFKGTRNRKEKVDLAAKDFLCEDYSWFGPLGFFLLIPAIFYSLFFGHGFIRTVALTLLAYYASVSYSIGWMPWNNRFFSLFFGGAGLCVGFLLSRLCRKEPCIIRYIVVIVALYSLLQAVLLNNGKPTVPYYGTSNLGASVYQWVRGVHPPKNGEREWTPWWTGVGDRDATYTLFMPPDFYHSFLHKVEKGKKVLISNLFSPLFPLLFKRPDLQITVSNLMKVRIGGKTYFLSNPADYAVIRLHYDYLVILVGRTIKKSAIYPLLSDEEEIYYSSQKAIYRLQKKN